MTVAEDIAARVAETTPAMRDKLIAHFVDKEVERRAQILIKGYEATRKAGEEADKIKPDFRTFDLEGKIASQGFTDEGNKKRNQAIARASRLERALMEALSTAEYKPLEELLKQGQQNAPEPKPGD